MPYKKMVDDFKKYFIEINFQQIPKFNSKFVDAMATIASLINMSQNTTHYEFLVDNLLAPLYEIHLSELIYVITLDSPLYDDIFTYLHNNTLPLNLSNNQRCTFICQNSYYVIIANNLYWRGLNGTLLRCLEHEEAQTTLCEVHDCICGAHSSGPTLAKKLMRIGYY